MCSYLCRLSNALCMGRDPHPCRAAWERRSAWWCPNGSIAPGWSVGVMSPGITGRRRRDKRPPHSPPAFTSSPTQPWKGGCWGSDNPLTRAFASSKPLPIPLDVGSFAPARHTNVMAGIVPPVAVCPLNCVCWRSLEGATVKLVTHLLQTAARCRRLC